MKKIIFVFITLFLISCEIQYEGDNRLLVTGSIIDKNGNPIPDLEVITNVSNGSGWGSDNDDIGIASTNNQGIFKMLFPKPKGKISYIIEIKDVNQVYQEKKFINIFYEDFYNYSYNLGEIKLYKANEIVNLNISFNNENYQNKIVYLNVLGEIADTFVQLNSGENIDFYYNQHRQVMKNQTIVIEYKILNYSTNQITTYSENIEIGEQNVLYTITY